MDGVTQKKFLNHSMPWRMLQGQIALVHHIMAEANPGPRLSFTPEVEGHLFGLLLGSSEPRPAHDYEAVRR